MEGDNQPTDMIRPFLVTCDNRMIEGVADHWGGTNSLLIFHNNDAHAIAQICTGRLNLVQKGPSIVSSQLPNGQIQVQASRAYRAVGSEASIFTAGVMIETDGPIRMFGHPAGEDDDNDDDNDDDADDDDGDSGTRMPRSTRSKSMPKASAKTKAKAKAKPKAKVKAKSKAKACCSIIS